MVRYGTIFTVPLLETVPYIETVPYKTLVIFNIVCGSIGVGSYKMIAVIAL